MAGLVTPWILSRRILLKQLVSPYPSGSIIALTDGVYGWQFLVLYGQYQLMLSTKQPERLFGEALVAGMGCFPCELQNQTVGQQHWRLGHGWQCGHHQKLCSIFEDWKKMKLVQSALNDFPNVSVATSILNEDIALKNSCRLTALVKVMRKECQWFT